MARGILIFGSIGGVGLAGILTGHALTLALPSFPSITAQAGLSQPTSTPAVPAPTSTEIAPATSTADPVETQLSPQTDVAQSETRSVSGSAEDGSSFTAVSIVAGAIATIVVLIVGAVLTFVRRRPQAD
jgi:nitrate reductase gamma subunit